MRSALKAFLSRAVAAVGRHLPNCQNEQSDAVTLALVVKRARRARLFLDVGSNRGLYARAVRNAVPWCRVVAYEPTPDLACFLRSNGIKVVEAAVGARRGTATFYVSRSDEESTLLADRAARLPGVTSLTVNMVTIDGELERFGVPASDTLLKIDVEGVEREVWAGMQKTLAGGADLVIEVLGRSIETGFLDEIIATSGRPLWYLRPSGPVRIERTRDFARVQHPAAWNFWLPPRAQNPDHA